MHGRALMVGTAVLLATLAATSSAAFGANQQVTLGHDVFMPPRVAVMPGESVTWTNPDPQEQHNVHFEDHSFIQPNPPALGPWTRVRTFATEPPGAYPYYCEIHGAPGGIGMSGTVYVNVTGTVPPTALLSATPGVARVGETVTFSGSASTPGTGGAIVKYEWDLDGDGIFGEPEDAPAGAAPSVSRSYASPTASPLTIRLRVTDAQGQTAETTDTLRVTEPPTASFTVSPSPAQTGQAVTFNASTSVDPDGSIARYQWDLDGNGSFETDTGESPTASRTYLTAATLTVRLRVTDNFGVSTETTRPLQVNAASRPVAPQPQAPTATPPSGTPAAPPACSSLTGTRRATCMQRACAPLRGSRKASCIQRSCRYLPRSRRAACVRKSCRSVSRSKRAACMKKSCRWLKGSKRRACLRKYSSRRP